MQGLIVVNGYVQEEKFHRQAKRIADALRRYCEVEILKNGEISAFLKADGRIEHGFSECKFAVYLDKDKYLGEMLESTGLRLFNRAQAIELCDDKMKTHLALAREGIKTVASIPAPLCYTQGAKPSRAFLTQVASVCGFPLVAKKSYGSFGAGVQLVHGMEELNALEEKWLRLPHFYQRYIAASAGRDIRVVVIGGRAVAAMERVAKEGEFRSNIELGGRGRPVDLSAEYRQTAERAALALGLDYCGVDLLESGEGGLVCEVNSNAFFEGIEQATGTDVALAYAEHILSEIK